ncbi:g8820 [Coccomyxa viridis]|uniref:G8820 protein n=1 Tax=Coccomyxa viridis TaxID=1274662 RepID=A0ABP1G654_9CHLO
MPERLPDCPWKVIVLTTPLGVSHIANLRKIAEELAQQRGHHITYVSMNLDIGALQPTNNTVVSYSILGMADSDTLPAWRLTSKNSSAGVLAGFMALAHSACRGLMGNDTAMTQLKDFKADVMLAEIQNPCTPLLAHVLDLPWVNHWPLAPISIDFDRSQGRALAHIMCFWGGLEGFLAHRLPGLEKWRMQRGTDEWTCMALRSISSRMRSFHKECGSDPDAAKERRRMVLSISPVDWAAEWLRPVSPSYKYVGPVLAGPGKALPAQFQEYMEAAGAQGVLLVSMGTVVELDREELTGMAAAFATLPCKVLWRLTRKEVPGDAALATLKLGGNTQVVMSVPQNDVLAHPNLRAFLSHVGVNSMYEAIYHGRPVVALPMLGDQASNADKIVAKGLGVRVDLHQVGKPAFKEALIEVLTDPTYTATAQAMSVKIRARKRTPVQEAADWIEHVIVTKGEPYLKIPEDEMSLGGFPVIAVCASLAVLIARAALASLLRLCKPFWLARSATYGHLPATGRAHKD